MTGFRAGGRLFSNINRRMTGCIKHFSLGFAANSTSVSLDTGIAAGRGSRNYALVPAVTLRRDNFLCNKNLIADGAVFTLSLAGCGAGSCNSFVDDLGMSLGGNSRAGAYFLAAILAVGVAGVAGLGAGCFLGITKFCVLMCARRAAPDAADIVDGIAGACVCRFRVGAVGVVQLGGRDGDGHRFIPVRIILIGRGFCARCTVLNIFAGSVAGADVCAALGGVDGTDSRQTAVYIHLGILQICIGAVIGFAGRIGNRLELARTPDKVIRVPFVTVINVDILAAGDSQISAFGNAHLNTGQQCGILVDGNFAGLDVDRDVVGDWQYIACGVNAHTSQLQRKGIQLCLAVHSQDQTVCLFIVVFGEAAGGYFEHTIVTNETDCGSIRGAHCINATENLFIGARIQRQRNFDILNEILGEGKNLVAHVRGGAAAAEIRNLVELIHGCTGFCQNRAAAGDKAPSIEITAVLYRDGAVIRHFDIAIIAYGASLLATAGSEIPAA